MRQTLVVGAPTGLVTLMFTDIEGSTRAWEAYPAEMQLALERHDEILCAAFGEPAQAVRAGVGVQRALAAEQWPPQVPIRLRIGIHSGVCQERDGDYFGPTVNRAARIQATAGEHVYRVPSLSTPSDDQAGDDGGGLLGVGRPSTCLDGLTALVDNSLVETDRSAAFRYRLLESVRQYAACSTSCCRWRDVAGIWECSPNGQLGIALLASRNGDFETAAELHGAADAIHDALGTSVEGVEAQLQGTDIAVLRAALGDTAFDGAYARGVASTLDGPRTPVTHPTSDTVAR